MQTSDPNAGIIYIPEPLEQEPGRVETNGFLALGFMRCASRHES